MPNHKARQQPKTPDEQTLTERTQIGAMTAGRWRRFWSQIGWSQPPRKVEVVTLISAMTWSINNSASNLQCHDIRDSNICGFIRNVGTADRSPVALILASQLHPLLPPLWNVINVHDHFYFAPFVYLTDRYP